MISYLHNFNNKNLMKFNIGNSYINQNEVSKLLVYKCFEILIYITESFQVLNMLYTLFIIIVNQKISLKANHHSVSQSHHVWNNCVC